MAGETIILIWAAAAVAFALGWAVRHWLHREHHHDGDPPRAEREEEGPETIVLEDEVDLRDVDLRDESHRSRGNGA